MSAADSLRRLEAAGFTREQAEAILNAQAGQLATKADLAELKVDMLKVAVGLVLANAAFCLRHRGAPSSEADPLNSLGFVLENRLP